MHFTIQRHKLKSAYKQLGGVNNTYFDNKKIGNANVSAVNFQSLFLVLKFKKKLMSFLYGNKGKLAIQ